MKGYDVKVRLDDFRPLTWRDLIIPENITFHQLHLIMQELWDFKDYHLYEFSTNDYLRRFLYFDNESFGDDYIHDTRDFDSEKNPIKVLFDSNKKVKYCYDFGDSWSFTIEIKKKIDYEENYPYLKRFKGKYNPIEDCGGTWGLSVILTTEDEEYKGDDEIGGNVPILDLEEKREALKWQCEFNNPPLEPEEQLSGNPLTMDFHVFCLHI